VQSILVGGHDVAAVLARDDYWYCQFFEYVAPGPVTPALVKSTDTATATTTVQQIIKTSS
jgi:hypothetical protein